MTTQPGDNRQRAEIRQSKEKIMDRNKIEQSLADAISLIAQYDAEFSTSNDESEKEEITEVREIARWNKEYFEKVLANWKA